MNAEVERMARAIAETLEARGVSCTIRSAEDDDEYVDIKNAMIVENTFTDLFFLGVVDRQQPLTGLQDALHEVLGDTWKPKTLPHYTVGSIHHHPSYHRDEPSWDEPSWDEYEEDYACIWPSNVAAHVVQKVLWHAARQTLARHYPEAFRED